MVRGFFLSYGSRQLKQLGHTHGMTADTRHLLLALLLAFLSPFWMTGQSDDWTTGHVTLFFSIQFNAPSVGDA